MQARVCAECVEGPCRICEKAETKHLPQGVRARQNQALQQHECRAHVLEEEVQLGVGVGVPSDLKEGVKDVVQQLLKVLNDALLLVHIVQPWQLHPNALSQIMQCDVNFMEGVLPGCLDKRHAVE